MSGSTLDLENLIGADALASQISQRWEEWDSFRLGWLDEKSELRNYVYATDTGTTSNASNVWRNRTIVPKIAQIYDNLLANYMSALFPSANWLRWEGDQASDNAKNKKRLIQAYMMTKIRQSGFEQTVQELISDWILYGNCFATVEYARDYVYNEVGEQIVRYEGPRLVRISPFDIVFNPIAASWEATPKIIRSVISLGEVQKMIEEGRTEFQAVFDKMLANRASLTAYRSIKKSEAFVADGFSDITQYYNSGLVEVLTFYGDIFDVASRELKKNRRIIIVDRAYVIFDEANPSWLGSDAIFHSGWRSRPDNLYAMGPLDNLVGIQYRINHLENLRADVFDQIANPILKVKGSVEDFDNSPGSRIYCGEEGDVTYLVPDATALQADFQISTLENKMEEMAGAPRQAMGIRTPGEKTAFEVQTLENSASRIFTHKARKFEQEFLEIALNAMLEAARRNMNMSEVARSVDEGSQLPFFPKITKDDLRGNGRLYPVGARHFAERAKRVQEITQLMQLRSDPTIGAHLSGKRIAQIVAEELGEATLFTENVTITEQMDTQKIAQEMQLMAQEEQMVAMEQGD